MRPDSDASPGARADAPVLFIADGDDEARATMQAALLRRFGFDYQVVTADSSAAGLGILEQLAQHGASLAGGMSSYLITQINATANIDVRLHTRVIDGNGGDAVSHSCDVRG